MAAPVEEAVADPSGPGGPGAGPGARAGRWLALVVLLVVPAGELVAHALVRSRVVGVQDWTAATQAVAPELRAGDAVVSSPGWTDPLLRQTLGDRIPRAIAGRSDLAPFERLWALSIRDADPPEAPGSPPALDRRVGPIRIRRWDLGPSPVRANLIDRLPTARVSVGEDGVGNVGGAPPSSPCPWRRRGQGRGGGLGAGPFTPAERFECDPRRPWLWVGETVVEDLDLAPRRCIWQHPDGTRPVTTIFPDLPLGDRIVLYAGLYYEHERDREGGPVVVEVAVDGAPVGRLVHRDGDGWKRLEALTRAPAEAEADPDARGTVSVSVTAENPRFRSLCWAATTRAGRRERAVR